MHCSRRGLLGSVCGAVLPRSARLAETLGTGEGRSTTQRLIEPRAFSRFHNALLEAGEIRFASNSAVATLSVRFRQEDLLPGKCNPDDAGDQPGSNRYYFFVQCGRDRRRGASITMGGQTSVPEYSGEVGGIRWEKFTPLVIERPGDVEFSFCLGAGASLRRALLLREPYPYWIVDALPGDLRGEIQTDLRSFVRSPGVRKVDSGIVMSFAPEDRDIHCMAHDGKHVWCGFCLNPSRLLRVTLPELTTRPVVIRGAAGLHSLVWDGEALWAVHFGHNPPDQNSPEGWFDLTRVDPETCDCKTFRIEERTGGAYCATYDGRWIWIGLYRRPACAVAIDRSGRLVRRIEIPDTPRRCFRSIHFDGRYVWGGLLTRPGKIVRIDPKSEDLSVYTLRRGEDNVNSICSDGRYLWAGLETRPAVIVRLDPQAGTHDSITLNQNEDFCRAVVAGKGRIHAALYSTPATVVELSQNMQRIRARHLGPGEDHARSAVHDGEHLWVGLAMNRWNPGQLWRLGA